MKGLYLIFFVIILFIYPSYGQSVISGEVIDEESNVKLSNATIMLIQAQDSILVDFTRAGEAGKFKLPKPTDGDYRLIVSYPKYADYSVDITGSSQSTDIGRVALTSIAHMLEEVVVTGRIPILIKGDTTEYDAGSFTVEKNAKVEDLLKVLPGITVDASGKITAQGKTVEKVLVDGEEFFGDDPVLVTRNIRSDMVDKVQVYEKKSDYAERTGVDDGQRTQTINLKLREDAKHGMFGKAEAGGGTDKFYLGQGMLNYFRNSLKMSAYAIGSNTGKSDLSGEEVSMLGGESFGDGTFGGSGLPKSFSTGALYSDQSKDKKHNWRVDYKYNEREVDLERSNYVRNSFGETILESNNETNSDSYTNGHNINLKHESRFDSLTTVTVWAHANRAKANGLSHNISSMVNHLGEKLNENTRDLNENNRSETYRLNTLLTRRFNKKGRALSVAYNINGSKHDGDQFLYSNTRYYRDGVFDADSIIDQYKDNNRTNRHHSGSISYSEPLTKDLVLTAEYKLVNDFNHNLLESYNKNTLTGRYDEFNALYSNNFEYDTRRQTYSLTFNYNPAENLTINMSNFLENSRLSQVDRYDGARVSRSFLVYHPTIQTTIRIARSKSLDISYKGENMLPALHQIQPLRSNVDPLNEYLGNEDLNNAYTHTARVNFWSSNILSGSFGGFGAQGSVVRDALVQNVETDTNGKNIYTWENMTAHQNRNLNFYSWYFTTLFKKLQIFHGVNGSVSFGENYNYINGTLAKATSQSYSLSYNWRKSTTKGLDFEASLAPSYIIQKNSVGITPDSRGLSFTGEGDFKYFLPAKFSVDAHISYLYQAPTDVYSKKFERLIVNPGVSRKFRDDETLVLSLMVNDLFNKNVGFSRMQSGTQLTEQRYNTIGRYVMLKLTWEINKMFISAN